MRIVFCGSGTFAIRVLEELLGGTHEIVGVVTPPPRRAGRGGKMRMTPVEQAAAAAGLPVLTTANINAEDGQEFLMQAKPDVLCVVEFGQFLKQETCRLARLGAFNLHASILPELRGAGPVNWAILRGYKTTGVSTFFLVDKMDAGPVLLTAEVDILSDERADSLRQRLADRGAALVLDTLQRLADGTAKPTEQNHNRATFAPMLKKSDGWLDFARSAEELMQVICGTYPWPGAQAIFHRLSGDKVPVTIGAARIAPGIADVQPGLLEPELTIATGQGRLEILEIKPAGKRMMRWKDFCNGYRVVHGGRFVSPAE